MLLCQRAIPPRPSPPCASIARGVCRGLILTLERIPCRSECATMFCPISEPLCGIEIEKLQCPRDGSRASLPGSVSSPQTLPRGPATATLERNPCGIWRGAPSQFRRPAFCRTHPIVRPPPDPPPSRASLHCHREPSLHCLPTSIALEARSILALEAPLARHTRPPASQHTIRGV